MPNSSDQPQRMAYRGPIEAADTYPTLDAVFGAFAEAGLCPEFVSLERCSVNCPWAAEHPDGASPYAAYLLPDEGSPYGEFQCTGHAEPPGVLDLLDYVGVIKLKERSSSLVAPASEDHTSHAAAAGHSESAQAREVDEAGEMRSSALATSAPPFLATTSSKPAPQFTTPLPQKANGTDLTSPRSRPPPDEPAGEAALPRNPPTSPRSGGAAAEPSDAPKTAGNPLRKHSLLGRADEIEARAAATKPLLGKFVMLGQATMIYAEPNTGKTLIAVNLSLDAFDRGRIGPSQFYYIDADDSSQGLATKLRLMQDAGAHMLAPGFNGFRAEHLVQLMLQAIENGTAQGTCIVIDTLKKFTDLMDKKRTSQFADVCRHYVMAGGTIIALGHTTKRPKADGTPQYQGTTDILEDFDAVYVAQPMASKAGADRVVKFTKLKSRADSPETVAYVYSNEPGISYEAKLASVRPISPDDLDDYALENEQISDPPVMEAIARLIGGAGWAEGKMKLAKAAAEECGVSHRAALEVLDRYTGPLPRKHLWAFQTGHRGRRTYRLIEQAQRES